LIDKPFQQNYGECLRYFQKSNGYTTPVLNGSWVAIGTSMLSNVWGRSFVQFPVKMANAPTIATCGTVAGTAQIYLETSGTNVAVDTAGYNPYDGGFAQVKLTANAPATAGNGPALLGCWTADTGW
jgi:hypothetical protein